MNRDIISYMIRSLQAKFIMTLCPLMNHLGGQHCLMLIFSTIKGGSRRAEKSHKVLMMMMMKAAKLGWAGPGAGQEQGRNRAGAELRIVKQSREERGQEQTPNTKVEKTHYWSALVGQLGRSKNSRSHSKNILCCSFPNVTPRNKFHPNRMKNTEVQIFDILEK